MDITYINKPTMIAFSCEIL